MMNFFLPILLMFSLSARDAAIQPNPYDYEFAIGIEKPDTFYYSHQWERQNGADYIDIEAGLDYRYKMIGFSEKYLSKTSKGLQTNTLTLDYIINKNFRIGYAYVFGGSFEYLNHVAFSYKYKSKNLDLKSRVLIGEGKPVYELNNKARFEIDTDFYLIGIMKYYNFRGIEDYQLKIGLEFQLGKRGKNVKG